MQTPADIRNKALEEAAALIRATGEHARNESEHHADSIIAIVCDRLAQAVLDLRRSVQ